MTGREPHGTFAGWRRHLRDGYQPCGSCEQAHRLLLDVQDQARLAESWRRLLDLIAGECRRAGMLP